MLRRLALAVLLIPLAPEAQVAPERAAEVAVLVGAEVPSLLGIAPEALAAYRWEGGWTPVPVQVDERAVVDLGDAYGDLDPFDCDNILFCLSLRGHVETLFYTDAGTFVGPDPDATLDADDEIALIAGDAGAPAPEATPPPPGTTGPGVAVRLTAASGEGTVYLFATDGNGDPAAGADHVRYAFGLLSGDYLATYDVAGGAANGGTPVGDALGANPEDTTVETDRYRLHYSDRWILDGLHLGAGPDLLDRRKVLFSPTSCERHETTGSRGEGAFVVNRDGPVRALRSVVGFNSGPLVQRTDVFMPDRVASTTALRVHPIPGVMDLMDYTPEAVGMTYHASTAPDGVTIDGAPDPGVRGGSPLAWEVVRGAPGALVIRHEVETTADLAVSTYYADNDTNPPTPCTGDDDAYGLTGLWVDSEIPNTDPRLGSHALLRATRTMVLTPEALSLDEARAVLDRLATPLAVSAEPFAVATAQAPEAAARLGAVWPNPASGAATVAFSLREAGPVRLTLIDALGREVTVVARGAFAAGAHRAALDLGPLAPGVYRVRLESASGVSSRALVRP